ncbi:MAG: transketolase [Candidatus Nanoarchaeia archaeon]
MNEDLRLKIAQTVYNFKDGHIPSAYSIVDIISTLYKKFLKYDAKKPDWEDRDYFILSKGHGCFALYATLQKYGFINNLEKKVLGGHPDCNKIPGVEASTGSLGHGICTAAGIALGLKIKNKKNKVITLIGDGESNEGTVWETALVAPNLKLGNLCVIVDNNKSTEAILPMPYMDEKWKAFGWDSYVIDGHNEEEILSALNKMNFDYESNSKPKIIIANTIKGKGVSFMENQGAWHHRIPNDEELEKIKKELGYGR